MYKLVKETHTYPQLVGYYPRYIWDVRLQRPNESSIFTTTNVFASLTCGIVLRMHIEYSLTRCRRPHGQAHGPTSQGTHTIYADIADVKAGANLELASACAGVRKGNCELEGKSSHAAINYVSHDSIE